jgi:hypothetical protein
LIPVIFLCARCGRICLNSDSRYREMLDNIV